MVSTVRFCSVSLPGDGPAIDPKDHIERLARGLSVIEAFDAAHPRMSASDVASRTTLTRTAARRHLLTLCHHGYAATDDWIIDEHLDPALLGVAMALRDRRGVAVASIGLPLQMRSWPREQ